MGGPFEVPMPMPGPPVGAEVTTAQALEWFALEIEDSGLGRLVDAADLLKAVAVAEVRRNGLSVKPPVENTRQ